MQCHGGIDVLDFPACGSQPGTHFRLFASIQGRIKAAHLVQGGTAHQHVAAKVQGATDRVDPVKVEHLGVERLRRSGLAPVAPNRAQLGLGQGLECALHKIGVQFGVTIKKQHILAARRMPSQVAGLGRARVGLIKNHDRCAQGLRRCHAVVRGLGIDVDQLVGMIAPAGPPDPL